MMKRLLTYTTNLALSQLVISYENKMISKRLSTAMMLAWIASIMPIFCQQWSLKTNLLSNALTVPSLGIESRVGQQWTAALDVSWMPLRQSSQAYLRHLKLQPEAHYWFDTPFNGAFIGPALSWRQYNIGGLPTYRTGSSRTQGFLFGAGCTAGWHFLSGNRWRFELAMTIGYAYTQYRRYGAPRSRWVRRYYYAHYIGPTAASVNLVYILQ